MRSSNTLVMLLGVAALLLVLSGRAAASGRRQLHDDEDERDEKEKHEKKKCQKEGRSFGRCEGVCVNMSSTETHCGKCNKVCMPGFKCVNGACTCPGDKIVCNAGGEPSCVDDASACATCLPPEPVFEYTCRGSLQPQPLNNTNGCSTSILCGDDAGAFCNSTDQATWTTATEFTLASLCDCDPNGRCGPVAFCARTPNKWLCYETCCDRNGTINIKGRSPASCITDCRCGGTDDLYVFDGVFDGDLPDTIDASTALVFNKDVVDYTFEECTVGQCFLLCENNGVILTDTVSATLAYTSLTACPEGTEEVSKRIASCGGMPDGE